MNKITKNVSIHLRSRQEEALETELFRNVIESFSDDPAFANAMAEGDDDMLLELRTQGTLVSEDGRITLSYDETELTGMEGSTTQVSFSEDTPELLTMLRSGTVRAALVFEQKVRHICVYDTPIMPFELCIYARKVENHLTMDGGNITLDYIVEFHGSDAERTLFSLDVTVLD